MRQTARPLFFLPHDKAPILSCVATLETEADAAERARHPEATEHIRNLSRQLHSLVQPKWTGT
jgi:hypothetical protein